MNLTRQQIEGWKMNNGSMSPNEFMALCDLALKAHASEGRSNLIEKLEACKLIVKDMGTFQEFTGNAAVPTDLLHETVLALRGAQSAMGEHPTERMRHAVLAEITTPGFFDMTPQDQANVLCLAVIHAANIRLSVDRRTP